MENNLPPGYRFHPTDEELITYYLTQKVSDFRFASTVITDVDLNKCEPWDLPAKAVMGEKEWYFFSLRDRKYPTGLRTNRATDSGYWKTTGKDKEIYHSGVLVGLKKTLVFYMGRAPKGEKSNWVMHEYRLETKFTFKATKDEWVVCRVFKKCSTGKRPQQTSSPMHHSSDSPCHDTTDTFMNEFGDIEYSQLNNCLTSSSASFNTNNNNYDNNNADTNMNWVSARPPAEQNTNHLPSPLLNWPSSLLTMNPANYSMNSMILSALQLGAASYQAREAMPTSTANINTLLAQQGEDHPFIGSNYNPNIPSSSASSTKVVMDSQQQSFNLDSIW